MAVDSREKRAGATQLHFMVFYPLADGTVGQPDRQQCAGVYPGITAEASAVRIPWHLFFNTEA